MSKLLGGVLCAMSLYLLIIGEKFPLPSSSSCAELTGMLLILLSLQEAGKKPASNLALQVVADKGVLLR